MLQLPPKASARKPKDRVFIAERDGWLLQHDDNVSKSGLRFKLTDNRPPAHRVAEVGGVDAPMRRVWNITYNPAVDFFGHEDAVLRDFYPQLAIWVHRELRDYCEANNLTTKKTGRKAKMETAND